MLNDIVRHVKRIISQEGIVALLVRLPAFIRYVFAYVSDLVNIHALKRLPSIDLAIDRVASLRIIYMIQKRSEISAFLMAMEGKRPSRVLEIGTAGGGTLLLLTRIAAKDATIISIDLPEGMFGGGYPDYNIPLYRSFASPGQALHLLRADSHDQNTIDKIVEIVNDSSIDLLFIDGDHSYEGAKQDFAMYSSLVRDGGIIAFHDIVSGDSDRAGGVHQFWDEVKKAYSYKEFVESWAQGGYGIGTVTYSRCSQLVPVTSFGKK